VFETVAIPLGYAASGLRGTVRGNVVRFCNAIRSGLRVYLCSTGPPWRTGVAMYQVTRCRHCQKTPVPMQGWVYRYCQLFEPWDRADRWIELSDARSSYRLLVRVLRAWRAVLVGASDSGMPPSPWDSPGKTRE
jgi:hypothetical protein